MLSSRPAKKNGGLRVTSRLLQPETSITKPFLSPAVSQDLCGKPSQKIVSNVQMILCSFQEKRQTERKNEEGRDLEAAENHSGGEKW